jgi:hypothetical protein
LAIHQKTVFAAKAEREGFSSSELEEYVKMLRDAYGMERDLAEDVALSNYKLNRGLEELYDNYENIAHAIENCAEGSVAYQKAMSQLKDILIDILDIDVEKLSDDFLTNNLDLFSKASRGNADALNQIRVSASNDLLGSYGDGLT